MISGVQQITGPGVHRFVKAKAGWYLNRATRVRWSGHVQGRDTGSHVFIWQAEFTLPDREREYGKGTLMFIR